MVALIFLALRLVVALFKSKSRLEAENAALRQQVTVLRRKVRGRIRLTSGDRQFFVELYRWFPSILKVITIVRPETPVRWHRAGFRRSLFKHFQPFTASVNVAHGSCFSSESAPRPFHHGIQY